MLTFNNLSMSVLNPMSVPTNPMDGLAKGFGFAQMSSAVK